MSCILGDNIHYNTLYIIEVQTEMNNVIEIEKNLIQGLLNIKRRYPDCTWLKECLEMNRNNSPKTQFNLTAALTNNDLLISQN